MTRKVAIVMGSASDKPILEKAEKLLDAFAVPYETHILSAHRTPDAVRDFAKNARSSGFACVIAAAGKAAHLAGAVASQTTLPVIGLPLSASLGGFDALLSTVQMPRGIPVATVAIDGAENAALLAIEIIAVSDDEAAQKLEKYRKGLG